MKGRHMPESSTRPTTPVTPPNSFASPSKNLPPQKLSLSDEEAVSGYSRDVSEADQSPSSRKKIKASGSYDGLHEAEESSSSPSMLRHSTSPTTLLFGNTPKKDIPPTAQQASIQKYFRVVK